MPRAVSAVNSRQVESTSYLGGVFITQPDAFHNYEATNTPAVTGKNNRDLSGSVLNAEDCRELLKAAGTIFQKRFDVLIEIVGVFWWSRGGSNP